jgi:cation diffusion facilitator CzcD-associated flavoprotein CzcO
VQYQLDDPGEYTDEHIFVIGGGDAGIENALGLIEDAGQNNLVTLLNRSADFPTAKKPNVDALLAARDAGRMQVLTEPIRPWWSLAGSPSTRRRASPATSATGSSRGWARRRRAGFVEAPASRSPRRRAPPSRP